MSAVETRLRLPPAARAELANGLTVIVFDRPTLPLVTVRLVVRAGSCYDPAGQPGLSGFTARLLRHGAGARDSGAFAEALDSIGGHYGAGIGLDHAGIEGEFTTATLDAGLDLFFSTLFEPRFDADTVARERERAVAEVVQARDEADHVADEAFQHFLFGSHGYAHPACGTLTSLGTFERDDVASCFERTYTPRGGVLLAVGDVRRDAFLRRLSDRLQGWHAEAPAQEDPARPEKLAARRCVLVHDPGSEQVQYRTGNVSIARRSPSWKALLVANTVLGGGFTSRLMQAVRVDRGLTYSVGSRVAPTRAGGPFLIGTFTRNESLADLDEVVSGELDRFHEEGPTDEELVSVKRYLAGLQVRRVETPEALASVAAEAELHGLGLESLERFRADVDAVTVEAARAAVAEAMPRRDRLTVLVGDRKKLEKTAARLGELTVVAKDFAESSGGPS